MIGTRLGPYELLEEIGQGGMATVYRAYQPSMDRQVAVKVINKALADDTVGFERFQREARLVARLEHTHILPVYDYNSTHLPPYIVMRFLPGGTLKAVLTRHKSQHVPLAQALRWLRQIASALDYAHRQNVLHRDLKPSNVMIDGEGEVYLTDFGVARLLGVSTDLTQTGAAMGTPAYMAPEQAVGSDDVGPRADVYSLGVIAFEMLAGRLPFEAETAMALALKHLQAPIPRVSEINSTLPLSVDDVLIRALAKIPTERFANAQELAQTLANTLNLTDGTTTVLVPPTFPSSPPPIGDTASRAARTPAETRTPTEQNKQVMVMHVSAAEFAETLYNQTEAEGVRVTLRRLWALAAPLLAEAGGATIKQTEEELTVVWGVSATREDDPERAIRAALALREAMRPLATDDLTEPLQMGLTTGMALLTRTALGVTASGSPLLQASRLLAALPDGGIVITHDLFRLVRGLFGVEPLPPLRARGSAEALKIYRVLRAKPRLARLVSREFEGVETRLVGREAELLQAQKAFEAAQEDREAHLVTILGEIGMGKSRLIYEFEKWRDLRPELVRIFRGRAAPESAAKPYALLRDLLMFRFELHDSDSPATLRAQIERGFADLMGEQAPEHAHLVGQLAGFDFDDSPHVRPLLGNAAQLHDRALRSLGQFFRATAQAPGVTTLMVIIEGLQWADDKSLEALRWLMRENAATPLLVMGAARPGLLERYPAWGAEHPNHTRLELRPLPKRETRKLVREVLQKVAELPDALRDLIAERSEGNPFYIEEMARMLLEDRVIVKGPDHWRVDTARLAGVRVPPTLTGLLQARLDSLTPDERTALQRAAVIGRIFWDTAVSALEGGDGLPIASFEALESLRKREFIHAQASSLFVGAHEYIFASQLLRDVAYESALQRQRRAYHARAAAWLLQTAGERAEEYTAHIAEHYERAGDAERAAAWFRRSGEQAHGISAYREAIAAYDRALAVLPAATGDQTRAVLLIRVASVYEAQADYDNARTRLQTALEMAQTAGDLRAAAEALSGICWLLYRQSDFERASRVGLKALDLARQAGDKAVIALTLWRLGVALYYQQHYESATARFQESLSVFQALGNLEGVARCFNTLGEVARYQKDYARAAEYYAQALDLVRQSGNRERIAAYLGNLGENARYQGDYAAAARHYHESLTVSNEIGARNLVAWHQINLGHVAVGLDDLPEAERRYREGIAEAHAMGVKTLVLDGLVGMAALWAKRDNWRRAAEMVGLALAHPALGPEGKSDSEIAFALLRAAHTPAEIEMAYAQGKALNLDEVVEELLK